MLYAGPIMKQYLVDRLALGVPMQEIVKQFTLQYNEPLELGTLIEWAVDWKEDVAKREKELLDELKKSSGSIYSRVEELNVISKKIMDELVETKKYGTASRYMSEFRTQLELLAKLSGELKTKTETVNYTITQTSNMSAMEMLEKDGIIRIIDRKRLRKLLGLSEIEDLV
jgi:hypothetical protein